MTTSRLGANFERFNRLTNVPVSDRSTEFVAGSRWASIWSRKPLTPVAVSDPERTTAALVDLGGAKLLVYGTVLPWYTDAERDGMSNELAAQGLNG